MAGPFRVACGLELTFIFNTIDPRATRAASASKQINPIKYGNTRRGRIFRHRARAASLGVCLYNAATTHATLTTKFTHTQN